jgi:hypothetical protein
MFVPGFMVPQFIELKELVHPLSEYTPRFAETFTVPLDDRFCVELMAANVVSVSASAVMTNAITAVDTESFGFFVFLFPL